MSTTSVRALAGATLALVALSGCGGEGGRAAALPTPSATPTASSPAPSASPTPPPSPRGPLGKADLEAALLSLEDLPTGYAVDRSADATDPGTASSARPECKALVTSYNAASAAGSLATASVSLDGGADNASLDEVLDAFPTDTAAAAYVALTATAVHACPELTIRVPDAGKVAFAVAEISFGKVGDTRTATRLTARAGDLQGLEVVLATVAVGDVVVQTASYDSYPDDAESVTKDAVDKVRGQVRGASTT